MKITLNGEPRDIPDGLTLSSLLGHLGITPEIVAIERNLDIVSRNDWPATRVEEADNIEIVHFVGGG